jgi:tetratricopeptide (TPR) repeat protein
MLSVPALERRNAFRVVGMMARLEGLRPDAAMYSMYPSKAPRGRGVERVTHVIGSTLTLLLLLGAPALAQNPTRLNNIKLCNGADRALLAPTIEGCTALIDSGGEGKQVLTIAYSNRGNAYAAKGEYDRAIRDFDESIKLSPNYAKAFNNRGVAYRKSGEHDRAIADFDSAIKLAPNYAVAFANRGETYQRKGEYELATRDYDEAIRHEPQLQAAWNGRCWTRAIHGELQAALADCNQALRLTPNDAAALDSRGLIYLKMGQFDAAIDDYASALRFDPKAAGSLYGRGLAKLKKGDPSGDADVAAARAIEAKVAEDYARYGIR